MPRSEPSLSVGSVLAEAIAKHRRLVLALCALLSALALWQAAGLRLETSLLSLLPRSSPAAEAYSIFEQTFGGSEKIFIAVLGPEDAQEGETRSAPAPSSPTGARRVQDDSAGSPETALAGDANLEGARRVQEAGSRASIFDPQEAAGRLEAALGAHPEVRLARSGVLPDEERFFRDHLLIQAPLLLDERHQGILAEKLEARNLKQRAQALRAQLRTPGGAAAVELATRDPLGLLPDLSGLLGSGLSVDPVTGTFVSADGRASLVVLSPTSSEIDPQAGQRLAVLIESACTELRQGDFPGLRCLAIGGPLYAAQDEALLRTDLQVTIAGSAIAVSLVLVSAFGGIWLPLIALLAVTTGLLWTAGWMGWAMSPVTAVSLGFAAVLVGLGIDYVVHGGTRFREAMLSGGTPTSALARAFRETGPALLTSALTTAGAFVVLTLAHFRPLAELGEAAAVGMLAILAATGTVGATLLLSRRTTHRPDAAPRRDGTWFWRALGLGTNGLVTLAERHARVVLATTVALSVVATVGLAKLRLDSSPQALRPANHPAFYTEQLLAQEFGLGTDTASILIPGDTIQAALEHAHTISQTLRTALGEAAQINSPSDWLLPPTLQESRLAQIAALPLIEAADNLERELAGVGLATAAFSPGLDTLRSLGSGRVPDLPPPGTWPESLDELLRIDEQCSWAAIRLRLDSGLWVQGPPPELVEQLLAAAPGLRIASAQALGVELGRLARSDLRRLATAALCLVAAIMLISFRGRLTASLLALIPVTLGCLWTLGLWGWLGRPLDLLSLAVVPILLGIGIDDGLHTLHGTIQPDHRSLATSARHAGRAMSLTTVTSMLGFGSLSLSQVPGLVHGGQLVALGCFACLMATLLVLPAIGQSLPWALRHEA